MNNMGAGVGTLRCFNICVWINAVGYSLVWIRVHRSPGHEWKPGCGL